MLLLFDCHRKLLQRACIEPSFTEDLGKLASEPLLVFITSEESD